MPECGARLSRELRCGVLHETKSSECKLAAELNFEIIHTACCRSRKPGYILISNLAMSGLEIAGLAFGILPILIEVIKSYSTLSKKARTLRHYSKEVRSISEQLKIHNGIFLNEVRLLLRSIEDEKEVENMLNEANDRRWKGRKLNDKIAVVLGESFDLCRSIIESTKDIIDAMGDDMAKFDEIIKQKTKVSDLRTVEL
jgi:hypothetical protein